MLITPEQVIADEISLSGLTPAKISAIVGSVACKKIVDCSKGRLPIDPELADLLSRTLGASPQFWINLENNYRQKLRTYYAVAAGVCDVAEGRVYSLGSFAQYADLEIDED